MGVQQSVTAGVASSSTSASQRRASITSNSTTRESENVSEVFYHKLQEASTAYPVSLFFSLSLIDRILVNQLSFLTSFTIPLPQEDIEKTDEAEEQFASELTTLPVEFTKAMDILQRTCANKLSFEEVYNLSRHVNESQQSQYEALLDSNPDSVPLAGTHSFFALLQELSSSSSTFLSSPCEAPAFRLALHRHLLVWALSNDKKLALWLPKLVPSRVSEMHFIKHYYAHCVKLLNVLLAVPQSNNNNKNRNNNNNNNNSKNNTQALKKTSVQRQSTTSIVSQLFPIPQTSPSSYTNKLGWGIIGTGLLTSNQLMSALSETYVTDIGTRTTNSVTAVCPGDGRNVESAFTLAKQWRVPNVFVHPLALIKDDSVDIVVIATPPSTHSALAVMCIAQGKRCIIANPIARNVAEVSMIRSALSARQVQLVQQQQSPMHPLTVVDLSVLRASPVTRTLKWVLGFMGTVTSMQYTLHLSPSQVPNVLFGSDDKLSPWYQDVSVLGGGMFLLVGGLVISSLDYILGSLVNVTGDALHIKNNNTANSSQGATALAENVVSFSFRMQVPQVEFDSAKLQSSLKEPVFSSQSQKNTPTSVALGSCLFDFTSPLSDEKLTILTTGGKIEVSLLLDSSPVISITTIDGEEISIPVTEHETNPYQIFVREYLSALETMQSERYLHVSSLTNSMQVASVVDAVLRPYYKSRSDSFWNRPHTWQPSKQ